MGKASFFKGQDVVSQLRTGKTGCGAGNHRQRDRLTARRRIRKVGAVDL
ncbi:hypothetical protein X748_27200 [Mesorhizobium sp. LNJC386A00]|nr:hypothetical protein X752_13335 [Mesorhizobium sp. LNJC398B00]ESY30215.1 hypothetical protein X748_27200 [Mesorhizobium sp. LNJC386A00]